MLIFAIVSCGKPTVEPWLTAVPLPFTHFSGAAGAYYMPEIMGSGAALIDYDNDSDLDIFLLQGHPSGGSNTLLRNDMGRFTDATRQAGLEHSNYGMGAATADFNNDGFTDLLVTAFNGNRLYRNNGNATFSDITPDSLKLPNQWSTSASFFDYDNDGWRDLVILNYIDYQFATNKRCQAPTGETDYCTPRAYRAVPSHLFHNDKGRFTDVTATSGFDKAAGPALGVVAFDANNDGYLDLFVANDSSANHLWMNGKNGTFSEQALQLGVAYSENGLAKAGMGVALGDYDNDGDEDLLVLNLMHEGATLFSNSGRGDFTDVSVSTGIHNLTYLFTGFGAGWFDVDRDGYLDLFLANGAVTRREEQRGQRHPFLEKNLLLRQSNGRFENVAIPALERPGIHRAAAFGDIDNDGDIDIVVNVNNGEAFLLFNTTPARNWLAVAAPPGSRVELKSTGLPIQIRYARTDSSYLAANDARVHFAAGTAIESLTIKAPGRTSQIYGPNQVELNTIFKF
ncbi:MAG: FG-GAP repeat domain-containing protein [Bryobacteraceae bacterium]